MIPTTAWRVRPHAKKIKVSMIDLSHKKGTLFKSRELLAEFLAAPDRNAHKDTRTVLVRGYRHLKSDTPLAFPDEESVPEHLRGVTIDPKADVLLEMSSNGLSGDRCEYYLRHHQWLLIWRMATVSRLVAA